MNTNLLRVFSDSRDVISILKAMYKRTKIKAATRRNFGLEVARESEYPTRLSFYNSPPKQEITLEEFQQWAIDRLIVLGEIESAMYRNKSLTELNSIIKKLTDEHLPLSANTIRSLKGASIDDERRKDHYSHFILRLAFCRSEDLRARFIRTELALFKYRYSTDDVQERNMFLEGLGLDWIEVSAAEKRDLLEKLKASSSTPKQVDAEPYFKVSWTKVPDLIAARRVYLQNGMAYVPVSEQLSLVSAEYANRLSDALELTARALPRLDEDDRLIPILTHLSKGFVAPEYTSSSDMSSTNVTAAQIPSLLNHFPLCMRTMHENLQYSHHLKHTGRIQYGLFLKGIGMSVEEALVFWRQSFSKVNEDKFAKEYRYNIRYNYGLEGSRKNYKPYSCQQILTGTPPGAGECHGCPYKHYNKDNLNAALAKMGINDSKTLKEVNDSIASKHFHVACTKVFEVTNPNVVLKESISHPNMYFAKSLGVVESAVEEANT